MTMTEPTHLIERAAARLRGNPGQPAAEPAIASSSPFFITKPDEQGSAPPSPSLANEGRRDSPAALTMAALASAGMVLGGKRARPAEEYRIAVSNILRSLPKRHSAGANLLMITSPKPNEGKSFSAINVAASIAGNGLREVLLVDADPKMGSITAMFGLADRPGLFDLVNSPAAIAKDVMVRTELSGLSIVPLGSNRTLLAEKGVTRSIAAGIERLSQKFPDHVIILDAPPCLATSDPSMLAPLVGLVVMVIEAERTQRESLVAALELVKTCKSTTLLLNKARIATTHSFGDYQYYGL